MELGFFVWDSILKDVKSGCPFILFIQNTYKDIKMLEYAMEKGNYSCRKQVVIELGEIKEDDWNKLTEQTEISLENIIRIIIRTKIKGLGCTGSGEKRGNSERHLYKYLPNIRNCFLILENLN